ncbi:transcriptional regulator [Tsukamurella sp. M9C]|uniref:PaaX family transcriptional regulator C-terminal domain-containing protein n=1 Tax=unclassified Tsukamurella TaxID=2633480 RepID=UPI001CCE7107|nr:PaaX family transcriptional regulator C-terminal domain-containing protein [Tsukamurella sp. M9C]MCA0155197.1 transcriptional regulator [Tsukamurella sp. M9C]
MADGLISTRALIEAMLREDATIDAGELYAVADALGMGDQQVRLAIKRLVAEGRFTVAGRGRGAVLTATDATRAGIEPDREHVRLMYAQDRGEAPWDGVWHLAGFAVPEAEREARGALRDAIVALGGAPVQGGLYASAHAWEEALRETAREAGAATYLTTLSSTDLDVGGARGAAAAARLWPLDELADGHRRLADRATEALDRTRDATHAERLALTVGLVAEFTRAHEPDPLLPPELLPPNWIGARARDSAARAWAALAAAEADSSLRLLRWFDAPLQPH